MSPALVAKPVVISMVAKVFDAGAPGVRVAQAVKGLRLTSPPLERGDDRL